jgi:hypothetical protein
MVCFKGLSAIHAGAHLIIHARIPAPPGFAGVGTKARGADIFILE